MRVEQIFVPENPHPFLRFDPQGPYYNKYMNALGKIYNKRIITSRIADWQPLDEAGIGDAIRYTLRQCFEINDRVIVYKDWEKLFALRVPVYKELCLEFLSTYKMEPKVKNLEDITFMEFYLGGQRRALSLLGKAQCLNIYTADEMRPQHFKRFLKNGARIDESISASSIWEQLSTKPYISGGNLVSDVTNEELRVIQRFLSHTISQRYENTEKVNFPDMWYLQQINSNVNVNIPYAVAWFLKHYASGRRSTSRICGGHFITLIARHFGIRITDDLHLTLVDDHRLTVSTEMYKKVKAIMIVNQICRPYSPPPSPPPEEQQQPEAEQQAYDQMDYQGYNPGAPSIFDVMSRLEDMQLSNNEFRQDYQGTSREFGYRLGAVEYTTDWMQHNQELYYANPNHYQPTAYQSLPQYGSSEAIYPPPMYNRDAALEEAQRRHQQQCQQRDYEDLQLRQFHDSQRQEEQRGAQFEDYFF